MWCLTACGLPAVSDSQSFPFESKTHPKLWDASWSVQERFSQLDVQDVVEFARMRGIRVMVEWDTPGHAASWCKGYPEVCPSPTCTQPLNPASPKTFELIEALLGECTGKVKLGGLFPESMIHLGGDEVNTKCWASSPSIMAWLQARNLTTDGGYGYFVNRASSSRTHCRPCCCCPPCLPATKGATLCTVPTSAPEPD